VTGYVRLSEAPSLVIQYPLCSTCLVDVEVDADSLTCPICGTSWSHDAGDGDKGDLYADWAGEDQEGPSLTADEAQQWAGYHEALDKHRKWGDQYPSLYREPRKPAWAVERGLL